MARIIVTQLITPDGVVEDPADALNAADKAVVTHGDVDLARWPGRATSTETR